MMQHHSSSRWKISTHLNSCFWGFTLLSSYPYSNSSHLTTIPNPSLCFTSLTPHITFDSGFSLSLCLVLAQAFTVSHLSYCYNFFHVSIPLPLLPMQFIFCTAARTVHPLYPLYVILNLSTLDILAQIILCWGYCPMSGKMFSNVSDLYSLDATCILQVVTTKNVCSHCQMSPGEQGGKITLG